MTRSCRASSRSSAASPCRVLSLQSFNSYFFTTLSLNPADPFHPPLLIFYAGSSHCALPRSHWLLTTLRFAVGIEEVNLYKDDGSVIHFNNPKFHVGSGATMYVVSGRAENKTIQDIIPSLLQNSALGQAAAAAAAAKKVLQPLHLWPHFRCDLSPSRFPSIFFPCL